MPLHESIEDKRLINTQPEKLFGNEQRLYRDEQPETL